MKFKLILILLFLSILKVSAQSQMITGQKHVLFVDIPKNWLFAHHDQLPFFIKPDVKDADSKLYMYAYGLDYPSQPDMNGWIKGDNDDMASRHAGLKIDSLPYVFANIKKGDYETGRYKTITYQYTDGHKEAMLVVECNNTIATVVFCAPNQVEFKKYLPAFKELIGTLRIMGAQVTIEK